MEALFFGSSEDPLYGVYYPPEAAPCGKAVLLCGPFGQSYMRSHRAFCYLAEQLASRGFHVMRFDYSGQGDSSGDLVDATVPHWHRDIATAIDELRDIAMVDHVVLTGLRLGALLMATLPTLPSVVRKLVLWDPLVCGDQLRREVESRALPRYRDLGYLADGFVLSDRLLAGLMAFDLKKTLPGSAVPVRQVVSHGWDESENLRDALACSVDDYRYTLVPSAHDWQTVTDDGGALWPIDLLTALVAEIGS